MSEFQASPELLTIYIEDARSHLEALDHCLLTLEREGLDQALVSGILGPLHTLKGNSGMMGFGAIKEYVHRLEDVFAQVGDGGIPLTPATFDQLFAGASALRDAVEQACARQGVARDLGPEKAALDGLLRQGESDSAAARRAVATTSPVRPPAPAAPGPVAAAEPRPSVEAHYVAAKSSTVRVDFSQLDHLLNLVGELIIARTKLLQLGKDLVETVTGRAAGRELMAAVQHVGGVSAMLQETVMDIRMLPVRHVFERFPRLVRDLAREQGKEIELILEGETTRVDKAIIDEIGEPLVHLIRNSVDHGIEPPEERVAGGKTRTGTILLSATQESSQVVITIMDDGSGIDASRVYRKAVERGILKGDETLTDREAVQLIFSQGFSTRESVTDVSGRGMGLDVVLKSIERLNGLVEVETVPGVGTKFIIQLPLTLAIISVLLVEVAGRTYAVPLSSVVETLRLEPGEVHRINHRETLRLRERIVPLLRLSSLFGLDPGVGEDRRYVVIVGRGDKRVGIVVDRLKGQQEVVIKALDPAVTGEPPVVAGATIMGDGRVVLILDVAALFEGKRQALRGRGEPGPEALAEGRRA
jgi:two-component system, chemotaxis family, sensor kinase CheA